MSNTSLYFRSFGSGKPIIFLHGFLGSHSQWLPFAKALHNYSMFLPDLPNHGNSYHIPTMQYHIMAGEVFEWIQSLRIEEPILIGHSYGGKLAVELVKKNPEAYKKLILVDSVPQKFNYSTVLYSWIEVIRNASLQNSTSFKELKKYFIEMGLSIRDAELFLKNTRKGGQGFEWKSNTDVFLKNYSGIQERIQIPHPIQIPTWLIRGSNSDEVDVEDVKNMQFFFPLLQEIVVEEAGHWVHVDNPDAFIQALLTCLENESNRR